jgi:hypothetical protein
MRGLAKEDREFTRSRQRARTGDKSEFIALQKTFPQFSFKFFAPSVQLNRQFVIPREQLRQIRMLREPEVYEAPHLETSQLPFPASSGP